MEEIKIQKTYAEFKTALDTEFNTAAESFNKIGYLLKVARDTDILSESGYKTVAEFAQAEYGLRKDDVSRFIAINDRYSENGYSERLAEKYRGFGRAKLQEMLSLPVEIAEEIPANTSKAAIQEIKKEYKEEQNITDIEVILEEKNEEQEKMDNNLSKVLHQLLHDNKDVFSAVERIANMRNAEMLHNALAPSGVATHIVRIAGTGKFMLTITDVKDNLMLTEMRTAQKEEYEWYDAVIAVQNLFEGKQGSDIYFEIYGEPYEESKVEPVQPEEPETEIKNTTAEPETEIKNTTAEQQAAVEENTAEEIVETEPDTEEIMNPYVEPVTEETETQISEATKLLCVNAFYKYYYDRINDAHSISSEIHSILNESYKAHIIVDEDYSVLIDKEFIIEKNSRRAGMIPEECIEGYIDAIIQKECAEDNKDKVQVKIENTLTDIKKNVDKRDYISALQYTEMLIESLKKAIEEENNGQNE